MTSETRYGSCICEANRIIDQLIVREVNGLLAEGTNSSKLAATLRSIGENEAAEKAEGLAHHRCLRQEAPDFRLGRNAVR